MECANSAKVPFYSAGQNTCLTYKPIYGILPFLEVFIPYCILVVTIHTLAEFQVSAMPLKNLDSRFFSDLYKLFFDSDFLDCSEQYYQYSWDLKNAYGIIF